MASGISVRLLVISPMFALSSQPPFNAIDLAGAVKAVANKPCKVQSSDSTLQRGGTFAPYSLQYFVPTVAYAMTNPHITTNSHCHWMATSHPAFKYVLAKRKGKPHGRLRPFSYLIAYGDGLEEEDWHRLLGLRQWLSRPTHAMV